MVYRIYVEKNQEVALAAQALLGELQELPEVSHLLGLRLLNRYDVEGVEEALFERCLYTVFAEPQTDRLWRELPRDGATRWLAVEYLPGQYDQRADSAAQCIQMLSRQERPLIRSARLLGLSGPLSDSELAAIRRFVINPVDSREAQLEPYETLAALYPQPDAVPSLDGFIESEDAQPWLSSLGLAMDEADWLCCRDYFRGEQRQPTLTEIKVLDTYWSDHCRHTTFSTELEQWQIQEPDAAAAFRRYLDARAELGRDKPVTLMDMATFGARYLKAKGILKDVDESPEINACTVRVPVEVAGVSQPWLLLFKNETHNHPTEIEPFGGAATCLGGAIRDPLSGRAYVYQAMRVTGAADPRQPLELTHPGKLPQRQLVTTAAQGYSSYGNQIGLATGLVDEVYHPGYQAKRMEIGAVVGAVPADQVRREIPQPGDVVLLIGGKTGRDGCGGATGSSKAHDLHSLESCGAEVQKGNAPEERKLQRLFRQPQAAALIKRCNDFGAGGVSVAIGELAEGLRINLDAVPKKYDGLDGTELAISESQERMAVVVEAGDVQAMLDLAAAENLQATPVAMVTAAPRLVMTWQGQTVVDISRAFLDSNGAAKRSAVTIEPARQLSPTLPADFGQGCQALLSDLAFCSRQGLAERFDSTVGAGTVLFPFGGALQRTPTQVMAAKFPVLGGDTRTCSVMSWGFDPWRSSASPYHGAYLAVVEAVAKLAAAGVPLERCYLTLQEYFPKPGNDPSRWGLPAAALLGALSAQVDLGLGAIGGKDSMSGSFEDLDVPPTLVAFAITVSPLDQVLSPEFKQSGSRVALFAPPVLANGLPAVAEMKQLWQQLLTLNQAGRVRAAWAIGAGGVAEGLSKMSFGNNIGFRAAPGVDMAALFAPQPGAILAELAPDAEAGLTLGMTCAEPQLSAAGGSVSIDSLWQSYCAPLAEIYPRQTRAQSPETLTPLPDFKVSAWPQPRQHSQGPRFLIPVFPGTNCEEDTAAAIRRAGGQAQLFLVRNLSADQVTESVNAFAAACRTAQAIVIPGGFSAGDEPDGSGKFITAFFRNPAIAEQVEALLQQRDGLICGICNGFQALIKLGLVPYGHIQPPAADAPTLSYNIIGRHQSRLVRTRICSNKSPWLALCQPGQVYTIPISHGEGRFLCSPAQLTAWAEQGQIAAQYVDRAGRPSMDIEDNPNGSLLAVEALTSPDGRVLGKMGHSERIGAGLYRNVPGCYDMKLFEAAVQYFSGETRK